MQKLHTTTALGAISLTLATSALAQNPQTVDIPEQPLAEAIDELSAETGTPILVRRDIIDGLRSKSAAGPMSPRQALEQIVGTPELSVQELDDGSLVVTRNDALDLVSQETVEDPLDLGTLVLRGELIERTVQESQTSAVIVDAEELEERGETSVAQTLDRIPGVSTVNGIVIRGITEDGGLGNSTTSSTISVTTDGIRLSDYRNEDLTEISTWDVEQVEVFRGSQSTQSGRNALAGAIVVEGAKPKFFPEYKARIGVVEDEDFQGADLGYQAAFLLNTPLVEDQLAFRLSVDKREIDGFQDNQTIRAGLLYEPIDSLSFGLTYTDIDNGTDTPTQIKSPRFTADYQINNALKFTSRTQYTDAETGIDLGIFEREREYETFDQEFRLIYETDRLRAIAGLFYTNIDEESVLRSTPGTPGPLTGALDEDIRTENYAIYGEVEYDLTQQWTVIAGLRYDVEDVVNTQSLNGLLFGVIPVSGGGTLDTTYDAFLPKLGVVHNFSEDISLGFTYQRGYRAGGIGVDVPLTGGAANTFEFDPEFTDTFELAYRSQSSDGSRILNANVFYTLWTDQQVSALNGVGLPVIANATDSELWGAEVDYRQFVNENLEVFASAAFVQTEFGSFIGVGGNQFGGNSFQFAPELVASIGANYAFDNGLSIGGDINYTSSTFSDAANTPQFKNDAYWVTNLNANYVFENDWVLTAYARNLFDEIYTTQQTSTGFIGTGPRREYGVYVTANF